MVGVLERPQSRPADFYRELGDIFSVKLSPSNRWGGFKALRERWRAHVASSRIKPVLLVDEAQEMSRGGPQRTADSLQRRLRRHVAVDGGALRAMADSWNGCGIRTWSRWGRRIRTRLATEAASREELSELLSHALAKAGNATLMTAELRTRWSTTPPATTAC